MEKYDLIVVGAGHAGIEAAVAASRMGVKTLVITIHLDSIGLMSCNPAIGGVGKGQLVKEIDALGGVMAKAADATAIQYRTLNSSKGPAVRSSRCQSDRLRYRIYMKSLLEKQENLHIRQAVISKLLVKKNLIYGVQTALGEDIFAKTIVITPGTFLNGVIHIGLVHFSGGRIGEQASISLAKNFRDLGFEMMRFKTGTCSRLDGRTINFKKIETQELQRNVKPFSFSNTTIVKKQVPCHITYTNKITHEIIRSGLDRSPLYTGKIKASGVRYCPSIEDKVVKFSDKERHQIFLEPEGLDTIEYYPNGLSTSLPFDIQLKMLRSIKGLEKTEITRPGYGIEHDVINPIQLYPTLETKLIKNLYLAGQINGTTGYEEAASQGLIAGINAALRVKGEKEFILGRANSYIGVLIDDLITKGTNEPYRMFTSRVEYRLILREDNADLRLRGFGYKLGIVSRQEYKKTKDKSKDIKNSLAKLKNIKISPSALINRKLARYGTSPLRSLISLYELLKRPQINFRALISFSHELKKVSSEVADELEIEVKYSGFINRQLAEVERFKNLEKIRIPLGLEYNKIDGLSREIKEKLTAIRPVSLGQALRISGVTPAAISILMVHIRNGI